MARVTVATIDAPPGDGKRPRSAGGRTVLAGHRDERRPGHGPAIRPADRPDLDPRVTIVEGVVIVVDEVAGTAVGEDEIPARADHAAVGALNVHPARVQHGGARRVQVRPGDRRGPPDLDVVGAADAPAAVADRYEQVVIPVVVGDAGALFGVRGRLGRQGVDGGRGRGLAGSGVELDELDAAPE